MGDRAEAITIDYEDLPLAGEDPEYPLPEAALAVRDKLGNADAVWVVVSEYKKEIPDSLRNLFDWLSLPSTKDEEGKNVLDQKPVAISGVGGFEELHPRIMVGRSVWRTPGMRLFPGRGRSVRAGRAVETGDWAMTGADQRGAAHAGR